ncbi:MAG: M20/M25/M40 family metallo-hydrolase [Planctomycetes bacterium]|jgi:hypothetical protein|nr:M20/M25/M40 family metallo-hydrolase [Planctomycetota bacterium]
MRRAPWSAPVLLLLLASPLPAEPPVAAKAVAKGIEVISTARAKAHEAYLAGPKCEGRASGEPGCERAAEYIGSKLREAAIEPLGEGGGYLQPFPVRTGPFPGQGGRGAAPRDATTANVVGVLRGSDEAFSREAILLGAHYDHIGYRDLRKGKIYFGADDNASGTTAVLMVAEAMAAAAARPRRSVVFAFFSAEERGLFGSKHYVGSPAWPIADTVAMLNLDMVGRNEPERIDIYGNRSSPELDAANARHEKASGFRFVFKGGSVFAASDHYPFYERGIPVLFFTSGLHKDYHALDDEPRAIVFGKLERIAEHVLRLVWDVGCADARPTYEKISASGAVAVLGIKPVAVAPSEASGLDLDKGKGAVEVQEVMRGTPAETAGVKVGDHVLGVAGKYLSEDDPIGDLDALCDGIERRKKVPLLVLSNGRRKTVPVEVP